MKRPYQYTITYRWSGDCISEDHRGYRTSADGKTERFINNVFDGKDPLFVVGAEQAGHRIMADQPRSRSVKKLVIIVNGDQEKE